MRIERLLLTAYGSFIGRELVFGPAGTPTIVVGANEAGKSTSLQAIEDLLFGFPTRDKSPLDDDPDQRWRRQWRTDLAEVRVGGVIDGRTLIRRRAARGHGWSDGDGTPLEADPLAAALAGVDRALFARLWSLDHLRLRSGGEDLRAGKGALGEALFAASAGIASARRVQAALAKEADELWVPKGQNQPVRKAIAAVRELDAAERANALAPKKLLADTALRQQTAERVASHRSLRESLRPEFEHWRCLAQAAPLADKRAGVIAARAALGPVPTVPADASARRAAAEQALGDAARALAECDVAGARLAAAEAALPASDPVLAHAQAVRTLERRIAEGGDIAKARADRPRREGELLDVERGLADLARQAGRAAPITAPSDADQREVANLLARYDRLAGQMEEVAARSTAAARAFAGAEAALAEVPEPIDSDALAAAVDAARADGDLVRQLSDQRVVLARLEAESAATLAQVPGWRGDAASLAAMALPLEATVRAAAAALVASDPTELQRQCDACAAEIAGLVTLEAAGSTMPSAARLAALRQVRDRAVQQLVQALETGETGALQHWAGDGAPGPAIAGLIAAADAEADALVGSAEAVGAARVHAAREVELRARRDQLTQALAERLDARTRAHAAWQALWAPLGITVDSPEALADWLDRRARALAAATECAAAAERMAELEHRAERVVAQLERALDVEADAGIDDLPALLAEAQRRLKLAVSAAQARTHAAAAHAAAADQVRATADQERRTAGLLAEVTAEWSRLMVRLGEPADRTPDAARGLPELWQKIPALLRAGEIARHRRDQIDADEAAFAAAATTLAAPLGEAGGDADDLVHRLADRLSRAEGDERTRVELVHVRAGLDQDRAAADQRRALAAADLARLIEAAGVADAADLPALEQRVAEAQALDARLVELDRGLAAIDPDRAPAELAAAALAVDAAAASAERDAVAARLAALDHDIEEATRDLARLDEQRAGQERATAAIVAAQDREGVLAELAVTARQAMVALMASQLLDETLRRAASTRQAPLLRCASALFQRLTLERYAELGVEPDQAGRLTLTARTPAGAEVAMIDLSDGTRDQVFLALRLAALAERPQRLPFLGDDILVQFDDARAAAALAVLKDYAVDRQVILFTHHPHVAELAHACGYHQVQL